MCVPKFNASGINMYKYRYSVSDVSSGVVDTQEWSVPTLTVNPRAKIDFFMILVWIACFASYYFYKNWSILLNI